MFEVTFAGMHLADRHRIEQQNNQDDVSLQFKGPSIQQTLVRQILHRIVKCPAMAEDD